MIHSGELATLFLVSAKSEDSLSDVTRVQERETVVQHRFCGTATRAGGHRMVRALEEDLRIASPAVWASSIIQRATGRWSEVVESSITSCQKVPLADRLIRPAGDSGGGRVS